MIVTALLIAALVAFLLAAFGAGERGVAWTPLGLALCVIAALASRLA